MNEENTFESINSPATDGVKESDNIQSYTSKKNKKLMYFGTAVLAMIIFLGVTVTFAADILKAISPQTHLSLALLNTVGEIKLNNNFLSKPISILNGIYDEKMDITLNKFKFYNKDYSYITKNLNISTSSIVDRKNKVMSVNVNALLKNILNLNTYFSNQDVILNLKQISDDYFIFKTEDFYELYPSIIGLFFDNVPDFVNEFELSPFLFLGFSKSSVNESRVNNAQNQIDFNKFDFNKFFDKYIKSINIENSGKEVIQTEKGNLKLNKTTVTIYNDDFIKVLDELFYMSNLADNNNIKELYDSLMFNDDLIIDIYTNNKFKIVRCSVNTSFEYESKETPLNICFDFLGDKISTDNIYLYVHTPQMEIKANMDTLAEKDININLDIDYGTHDKKNIKLEGSIDNSNPNNNQDQFVFDISNLSLSKKDIDIALKMKYLIKPSADTVNYPNGQIIDVLKIQDENQYTYLLELLDKIQQVKQSFSLANSFKK